MEWVFFPLDEKLALRPGHLVPSQEEHLVHLATWMPFERARQMLQTLTGVQVSEATVRRYTEQLGGVYEQVQQEPGLETSSCDTPSQATLPLQMVLSADGAFVPLVGGVWAEVRTLAIGEVEQKGEQRRACHLSYFSRMTDALTFTELVEGEMERRHLSQAKEVAAVMDGAEWLQILIDGHRPDAVRILDFPHAAQRISTILETVHQAGHPLPFDARSRCLHLLKHCGPGPVLRWLRYLTRSLLDVGTIRADLAYLHKREAFMQYPRYQNAGWPIGSGMVESANKLVMQTRLKGPGMHWAAPHVNSLLALRNAVCNDRWSQAWEHILFTQRKRHQQERLAHVQNRQQQAMLDFVLAWASFLLPPSPARSPQSSLPPKPPSIVHGHPTASHPWRRPWVPHPLRVATAKK